MTLVAHWQSCHPTRSFVFFQCINSSSSFFICNWIVQDVIGLFKISSLVKLQLFIQSALVKRLSLDCSSMYRCSSAYSDEKKLSKFSISRLSKFWQMPLYCFSFLNCFQLRIVPSSMSRFILSKKDFLCLLIRLS